LKTGPHAKIVIYPVDQHTIAIIFTSPYKINGYIIENGVMTSIDFIE